MTEKSIHSLTEMTEKQIDLDITQIVAVHHASQRMVISERKVVMPNYSFPVKLLTGDEVAQILRISRAFAYRLMKRGTIPTIRMGRSVRVSQDSLLQYIRENNKYGQDN